MGIFDIFKQIESETPAAAGPPEFIIAGLGNIGEKYHNTRHNAGFIMLDAFAAHCGAQFKKHQFKAHIAQAQCGGRQLLLMKPDTYMNLSGQAVTEAMQFYHIPPERVLVIFDDINLDVGAVRIRKKGSDGGHNGMKNIIYLSGSDQFPRIRVGIGKKPHPDYDLAAWVLSQFSPVETELLRTQQNEINSAIEMIIDGKIDLAMNRYNTGKAKPKAKPQPEHTEEPAT